MHNILLTYPSICVHFRINKDTSRFSRVEWFYTTIRMFEYYLGYEIRKADKPELCEHCKAMVDSAVHILLHCPLWTERGDLLAALGLDLDLD